jgi:hypothetical protein
MAINDARDDELPCGVNHLSVFRGRDGLADFGDFAIPNKDRAVLDGSVRDGHNGGVLNQNDRGRIRRRASVRQGDIEDTEKAENSKQSESLSADEDSG